ncbi:hypothetical protein KAR91_27685 [Candidatus Pacearchaeota archaeon]|nr:hypothetical protein [Candidatus Pacearchaeota archaeon]
MDGNSGACSGTEPARQQRHVCINKGLVYLENNIEDLEKLIDRVKGNKCVSEQPLDCKPPEQCLAEFMETTTNRLDGYSERIRKVIDELNQTIF